MNSPLVADMAVSLLADSVATLDTPPERSFITWYAQTIAAPSGAGRCDQLTVSVLDMGRSNLVSGFGSMIPRMPRQQPSIPVAAFDVRLFTGCWPVVQEGGSDPTPAQITAAAEEALTLHYTLWYGINVLATGGTLFDDITELGDGCLNTQVGDWVPTGPPAGGYVAGHFPVQVVLLPMP